MFGGNSLTNYVRIFVGDTANTYQPGLPARLEGGGQRRVDPRILEQILGDPAERLLAACGDAVAQAVGLGLLDHALKATPNRRHCGRRHRSAAAKLRRALLEESADPLARVGGGEDAPEGRLLGLDSGFEFRRNREPLDLRHRDRRGRRQPPRPGAPRRVQQAKAGDDAIDEPVLPRLEGVDRLADQVQLERPANADEARQALRAAEARDDPQLDLRLGEAGLVVAIRTSAPIASSQPPP